MDHDKIYHGSRDDAGRVRVWVVPYKADAYPLPPRHDLRNHSPDGFEWGYGGSGPAQLALALLSDALGDDHAAQVEYQAFKWKVVSKLPEEGWELTTSQILAAVGRERGRHAQGN